MPGWDIFPFELDGLRNQAAVSPPGGRPNRPRATVNDRRTVGATTRSRAEQAERVALGNER
jgi:hypothetical protein